MAIICWGNLAKSADDTQRIEQSIQGYVEEHNENVNAHQIEGSSLYMHRINEKLDHALGSVDLTYLSRNKVMFFSVFESFDAWDIFADSVYNSVLNSIFRTSAVANNVAYVKIDTTDLPFVLDWDKDPALQVTLELERSDDVEAFWGLGSFYVGTGQHYVGFYCVNGTEYIAWGDGVDDYTEELSNIITTDLHTYRIEVYHEVPKIELYVDGVLKYTLTSNLPTSKPDDIIKFWIKTTENVVKSMDLVDVNFTQDR